MNIPSFASCSHWTLLSCCCSTPMSVRGIRKGASGSGSAVAAFADVATAAEPITLATVMAAVPARTDLREMTAGNVGRTVRSAAVHPEPRTRRRLRFDLWVRAL